MLLAICVDYGSGDGHDIYYITIQQIDYLIESIVKNRVAYSGNEPTKLHSFEDAISGVFKTLTVLEDSPQPHKPVFSENLDAEILKSRLSFREDLLKSNVDELSPDEIKSLLNRLNATVAPFLEEMSQAEMSLNEEIAQLVLATKSFWDSTSLISRRDLAEMTNYRPELVAFLDWLTEQHRPIEDVKTRLKGDLLSQLHDENYMQMVLTVNRLLQFKKYEYELEEIHEENPQTEDEWRQLVNRLVAEHNDMFLSGSIQENNIKNTREDTCNYYKQVKKSVSFQKLYSSLEDVVGTWLPHKIAHRQYESNTSNESSHPSRNP